LILTKKLEKSEHYSEVSILLTFDVEDWFQVENFNKKRPNNYKQYEAGIELPKGNWGGCAKVSILSFKF